MSATSPQPNLVEVEPRPFLSRVLCRLREHRRLTGHVVSVLPMAPNPISNQTDLRQSAVLQRRGWHLQLSIRLMTLSHGLLAPGA